MLSSIIDSRSSLYISFTEQLAGASTAPARALPNAILLCSHIFSSISSYELAML